MMYIINVAGDNEIIKLVLLGGLLNIIGNITGACPVISGNMNPKDNRWIKSTKFTAPIR